MTPTIDDPVVTAALQAASEENAELARQAWNPDPWAHRDQGYPISPEQGDLLYVLARAIGAKRVVEFATSIGISTICLAAAVRDNGGGIVIGSELIPEKVRRARSNVAAAGLEAFVDVREGDGLQTLRDVGGPIDLVLLDGWPGGERPSLDRRVLEILAPQMRSGALLLDDNGEDDVLELLRDPAGGFVAASLPFARASTEIAVKVG
ncbi:MAG: class I SAM-dependent methyltransferase [Solirubrobacteraceae bacterium]|nr:class I SAM-dependent methyltransferase [Solirubrobacteraceae bacterium]